MNNETFQNMQFLKETIGKFKDEMHKFISDPQYGKINFLILSQWQIMFINLEMV